MIDRSEPNLKLISPATCELQKLIVAQLQHLKVSNKDRETSLWPKFLRGQSPCTTKFATHVSQSGHYTVRRILKSKFTKLPRHVVPACSSKIIQIQKSVSMKQSRGTQSSRKWIWKENGIGGHTQSLPWTVRKFDSGIGSKRQWKVWNPRMHMKSSASDRKFARLKSLLRFTRFPIKIQSIYSGISPKVPNVYSKYLCKRIWSRYPRDSKFLEPSAIESNRIEQVPENTSIAVQRVLFSARFQNVPPLICQQLSLRKHKYSLLRKV